VFVPLEYDDALQYSSPLSLAYALEGIVPELAAAVPSATAITASIECEAGFRLFDHELLATDPVCVPEAPERIAAMDRFTYETLLALGIEPIAGTDFALGISNNLPYLAPQVGSATDIGGTTSINFELLLTSEPHLIFTLESYEATAELSAIAPTVSFTFDTSSQWREVAAATAAAVNAEEALAVVEAGYEARLEALQAALDVPEAFEIAVVRPAEEGLSLPVQNLFLNTILDDAGLRLPEAWDEVRLDTAYADITLERLELVDADVMLLWWFTAVPEADEDLAAYVNELETNPLWQALDVVQAGNVYVVGSYWIGSSYHAANAVIDDLFTYIAGIDPAEVSPNPYVTEVTEAP
jgi:iron complex transport system substrate-binding protein